MAGSKGLAGRGRRTRGHLWLNWAKNGDYYFMVRTCGTARGLEEYLEKYTDEGRRQFNEAQVLEALESRTPNRWQFEDLIWAKVMEPAGWRTEPLTTYDDDTLPVWDNRHRIAKLFWEYLGKMELGKRLCVVMSLFTHLKEGMIAKLLGISLVIFKNIHKEAMDELREEFRKRRWLQEWERKQAKERLMENGCPQSVMDLKRCGSVKRAEMSLRN